MDNVINFFDFLNDDSVSDETILPDIEEVIEDREALNYLGDDAFLILKEGISHRRTIIRLKSVVLLAELFPNQESFLALKTIMLDRNESGDVRFHVARHCDSFPEADLLEVVNELRNSKGCNDRIVAAILMGFLKDSIFTFYLLNYLLDSNNCVVIATFLTILKKNSCALLPTLVEFVKKASPLQLKLLEKNIRYYEQSLFYQDIVSEVEIALARQKIAYLPQYFNKPYSQEKLSKLDRPTIAEHKISEEQDLIFYEI